MTTPEFHSAAVQDDEIARLVSEIWAIESYFDTVEVMQRAYWQKPILEFMTEHCHQIVLKKVGPPDWPLNVMRLTRPDREAIEYLLHESCRIRRVDVALDIVTRSRDVADDICDFILTGLVPNKVAFALITRFKGPLGVTSYFHFRRTKGPYKNVVIYADTESRLHPGQHPCCHVEWRLVGNSVLSRYGLDHAYGLLAFDHRQFCEQNLRLFRLPNTEELGKHLLSMKMKRLRDPKDLHGRRLSRVRSSSRNVAARSSGNVVMRLAARDGRRVACNDLLYVLRDRKLVGRRSVARSFLPLVADWLMPSTSNRLWRKLALRRL